MTENRSSEFFQSARLSILGIVVVIIVIGLTLVIRAVSGTAGDAEAEPVNVLASSDDECVVCHERNTPGIIQQYGHSTMAAAEVTCRDCHEVQADYPGAVEHEGTHVLNSPTAAMCERCHEAEVAQFNQSRHSLPASSPTPERNH